MLAFLSIEIKTLSAEGRLQGRERSICFPGFRNPPGASGGAWGPPLCARLPRTGSRGDSVWLARPLYSSPWSRSASTLVAENHSNPGLPEILVYPLQKKENSKSGDYL